MTGILLLPVCYYLDLKGPKTYEGMALVLASGVIHSGYVLALGWAYTIGDLSAMYPLFRGLGIAGTTFLAWQLGLDSITLTGALGILVVLCGVFTFGFKLRATKVESLKPALVLGGIITSYSIVDKISVLQMNPLYFLTVMNLIPALILSPLLLTKWWPHTKSVLKSYKASALLIGFGGGTAYIIILWAYQQTAAGYVVALRETSIIVAFFLGVFLLKEPISKSRLFGLALIVAGAIIIRFA